ncbi:MAG: hypothetical protein M1818_003663 [Claussenomyces sp. TS43310]|nr:MAG: hypothetical protein M1818_003663 [Claussenomyces sp. TS43310]
MTERTHLLPPPIATTSLSAFNAATPVATREPLLTADIVDEEPYTIKCICDYQDDDGATIYCETCDTWQHIECFYHGNVEEASRDDFNHFCADCKPRALDRRKATERQRQQREDRSLHDTGDKKAKRPPSKSHKKKPKPFDGQINGSLYSNEAGHNNNKNGSPHDASFQPKKPKSSHRSHQSISSQTHKRSPSHNARSHAQNHPPSPVTTPPDLPDHFLFPTYSKQLRDLYDNDPGPQPLQTNSFANLNVTNDMSLWLRDPQKLKEDAGVNDSRDVFQMVKPDFDFSGYRWPELQVKSREIDTQDSILRLRYLSVIEPLRQKDSLVGELKGFVGFQKDYYAEETEGFARLCHPAPFVFFHPHLPLYIDTRHEGSQCRYVRRSCRANTTLDTYITNKSEYHFCILNERPLNPSEQITIPWDFRFKAEIKDRYLHLLGLSDDDNSAETEVSTSEYVELSDLISNVLSDYGGCACSLGTDCAFARFHRHYLGKLHSQSNGHKPKKARKSKPQISPTSTSQATNSRDASEGRQEHYDAEDDSRSTSGSVRSKPQSRDMTPFRHVSEGNGTGLTEQISEREKRKLVDIEKKFEMMDQAQPPRKKKRSYDGPPTNGSAASASANQAVPKTRHKSTSRQSISIPSSVQVNGTNGRQYKDAATSRQSSYSPAEKASPAAAISPALRQSSHPSPVASKSPIASIAGRNTYVNMSTQTDPVSNTWYSDDSSAIPKKTIVPLGKRLLSNRHKLRAEREAKRVEQQRVASMLAEVVKEAEFPTGLNLDPAAPSDLASKLSLPTSTVMEDPHPINTAPSTAKALPDEDVVMEDLTGSSTSNVPRPNSAPQLEPGSLSTDPSPNEALVNGSPVLKVKMPLTPTFPNSIQAMPPTSNGMTTPSLINGSTAQSPFANAHLPPAFSTSIINNVGQHPSPVKKKLSLSDYKARMKKLPESMSKPAVESDSVTRTASSQQRSPVMEEGKLPSVMEGSAIVESPSTDKVLDPLSSAGAPPKEATPGLNGIQSRVNTGLQIVSGEDPQGKSVTDEQAEQTAGGLHGEDAHGEAIFAHGTEPEEPEVEDGHVGGLEDDAARVSVEAQEAQAMEGAQGQGEGGVGGPRPAGDGGLKEAGAGVEAGQTVAGARDKTEELGGRVEEIGDLGQQEEEQGLGEVAEDGDAGEDGAGEVAVGVADENAGGVPIVGDEGEGDAEEGQEEVEGEEVRVGGRVGVGRGRHEVEGVVEDEQGGDDEGLRHLDAVDAGEDVDAVGAEDGDAGHVGVVQVAEIEEFAQVGSQRHGDDDAGDAKVDKVDDEDWDGGKGRDEELVSPADVEDVVANAEDGDGLKREDG